MSARDPSASPRADARAEHAVKVYGTGEAEVRALARVLGLEVANKPALACLSSRVRTGLRITPELLARIDEARIERRKQSWESAARRRIEETRALFDCYGSYRMHNRY